MARATKAELEWAYLITREEILKRINEKVELKKDERENIRDNLLELIVNNTVPIYEQKKMNF